MIAYVMVYAAAVGLPILLAASAAAAALRRYGRPERGVWLVALTLALGLPVAFLINPLGITSPGTSGTLTQAGPPAVASAVASAAPPEIGPPATGSETLTLFETGLLGLPNVVPISPEQSALGLNEVILLVWLLASVILMLRWAVAAFRLARLGSSWRADTVDGVRVWLTSDLGPAVSGVLRTRILAPSWLVSLPEEQRSLVLLHEEEHIRARDPALLAFSRVALILAPWNPVVWRIASRLLHAVELDCDRRVLLRRPDVATYGDTLLKVSARDSSPLVHAAAFAESEVPLRKRIVAMTTPPRSTSASGVLAALALGLVLLIGSCEVPVPITLGPDTQDNVVQISMDVDGSVRVNAEPYPMGAVSAVVATLYAGSESTPVTSLRWDNEVPYRYMDELQRELVEAGVVRVVFDETESPALQAPPDDVFGLLDRGVDTVLQSVRYVYETLAALVVRPPADGALGIDDARLATADGLNSGGRLTQLIGELQQAEDGLEAFLFENRLSDPSPQLRLEHEGLLRAVTMTQDRLATLTQELKRSRAEKARNMPVLPQQGQALELARLAPTRIMIRVPEPPRTSAFVSPPEELRFLTPRPFIRLRPVPVPSAECREAMIRLGWEPTAGGFRYGPYAPALSTGKLIRLGEICRNEVPAASGALGSR